MTPLEAAELAAEVFAEICGRLDRMIELQEKTNEQLLRIETHNEARQLIADLRAEVKFESEEAAAAFQRAAVDAYPSDVVPALARGLGALLSATSPVEAQPAPLHAVSPA